MTDLQLALSKMLSWFHSYCAEHNLRYYVIGGTMLGTVRHKGFIPWDDDIDVGMPRADYDRLCSLMAKQNSDPYQLEYPGNAPDFPYLFAKLYDPATTLIERARIPVVRGIYLDIFPLDGLGNDKETAEAHYKKIKHRIDLHLAMVCALRKGRSFKKNLAVLIARMIPNFILSPQKLTQQIEELRKTYDFDDSLYVSNTAGAWGARENFPRSVFGPPTAYPFENGTVLGPEQFDAYLSGLYGSYMTPPPPEKQVSHHDFSYLDLETPYKK